MGTLEAQNKQIVERYWNALARRDWDAMAAMLAPDAHYTDVGTPGPGGTGPDGVLARLRIGIEPLEAYWHYPGHIVAEGNIVFTEHVEHWQFHTGESFDHAFVSVIEGPGPAPTGLSSRIIPSCPPVWALVASTTSVTPAGWISRSLPGSEMIGSNAMAPLASPARAADSISAEMGRVDMLSSSEV